MDSNVETTQGDAVETSLFPLTRSIRELALAVEKFEGERPQITRFLPSSYRGAGEWLEDYEAELDARHNEAESLKNALAVAVTALRIHIQYCDDNGIEDEE